MATANKSYFTSSDLISSIKRRANIPDTQDMIADNEILEFANEEMLLNFIPLVYTRHEDYYLVREVIPLVAGTIRYSIPYRSIATKVREVAIQDANGNLREMRRISIDEVTASYEADNNYTRRYYFEGEEIVIHTNQASFNPGSDNLVVFYNLRPNSLVDRERVGVITGIMVGASTTQINLDSLPINFAPESTVDFIKTRSPHRVISFDKVIQSTGAAGFIIVNNEDVPSSLIVGDRVASSGETDLINAPSDLHVMLAQMVAERVLEALGDQEGLQAASVKLQKMELNSSLVLDNRAIGSPIKAKAHNSTIRRSGLGRKRRNYSIN